MSPDSLLETLPENWKEFLEELDGLLPNKITLHCLGGFVMVAKYGMPRATRDLDYVFQVGGSTELLMDLAGEDSRLAKRHEVYLEYVAIQSFPEEYETRLSGMLQGCFTNLVLLALDPYDLILTKLSRNSPADREDVKFLAASLKLRPEILRERYVNEMRNTNLIGDVGSHDLTLRRWTEDYFPP